MIYDKLQFDSTFDTTKFGDTLNFSDGTKRLLSNYDVKLTQWQLNDIACSSPIQYYQNPLIDDLNDILLSLETLRTKTNTHIYTYKTSANAANNLFITCNNALGIMNSFIMHTNRLSGVERSNNSQIYSDLQSALTVGQSMIYLTNASDNINDNRPLLGSFTSLFIGSEISTNNASLSANVTFLTNSIYPNNTTFITTSNVNTINTMVYNLSTFINNRMSKDLLFYTNAMEISKKLNNIRQFSNIGGAHSKLLNIIGTTHLKNSLSS